MAVEEYLSYMKDIQNSILEFIDNEDKTEERYQKLIQLFIDQKIQESRHKIDTLLYLISSISNNHFRVPNFFAKIEKLIKVFRKEIDQYFTNTEIFNIFKRNKRIILFLLQERIMQIDQYISSEMTTGKYKYYYYPHYFFNEIRPYIGELLTIKIQKSITDDFDEKRIKGENDSYICQLIQKDDIESFIIYVNKSNISLNSTIEYSIFETNPFLLKKRNETKLIEYAAFFGSIQIFKYLFFNKATITNELWLYSIHGKNEELIHFLEENGIEPFYRNPIYNIDQNFINYSQIKSFKGCLNESIKCHHNEIVKYIQDNYLKDENEDFDLSSCFHYYNFECFPFELNQKYIFHYLCKYNYFNLVEFLLKTKKIELNDKIILNQSFL